MKVLISFSLALLLAGCPSTVVRDAAVYKAEITWFNQAVTQQAQLLEHFVVEECECADAKFLDPVCRRAAKALLTAMYRSPYHRRMALFNAGLTKERPPKVPPTVPDPSVLCYGRVD